MHSRPRLHMHSLNLALTRHHALATSPSPYQEARATANELRVVEIGHGDGLSSRGTSPPVQRCRGATSASRHAAVEASALLSRGEHKGCFVVSTTITSVKSVCPWL